VSQHDYNHTTSCKAWRGVLGDPAQKIPKSRGPDSDPPAFRYFLCKKNLETECGTEHSHENITIGTIVLRIDHIDNPRRNIDEIVDG
jgi:hypothetical protein